MANKPLASGLLEIYTPVSLFTDTYGKTHHSYPRQEKLTPVHLWLIRLKWVSLVWSGASNVDDSVNLIREKVACYNIIDCIFAPGNAPFLVFSASGDNCISLVAIERRDEKGRKRLKRGGEKMRLTYKYVASEVLKGCTHRHLRPRTCMVNPTTTTQGGGKKLTPIDLWLIHLWVGVVFRRIIRGAWC